MEAIHRRILYNVKLLQYNWFKAIADSLGTGLIRQIPFNECAYQEHYDIMNLNIRLRPTKVLASILYNNKLFEPSF